MSPLRVLVFFLVVAVFLGGPHLLIAWRLAVPFEPATRRLIWGALLANLVLMPTLVVLGNVLPESLPARLAALAGFVLMGVFSLLLAVVLVSEAGRLLASLLGVSFDADRRRLLSLGSLAATGALSGAALLGARRALAVKPVEVPVAGLAPDLDGLRIVQLTDIHIGPTIKGDFLRDVVAQTNALEPDIIAITGDLVDGSVARLGAHVACLADLRARLGVYFVTGNHEYYSGADAWVEELRRLGITVLLNEHRLLQRGAGRILLAGVTDAEAGSRLPGHASDPARALAGAPDSDLRVLLAHQPRTLLETLAAGLKVDLQLSGHTHGGQYFPGTALIYLAQPFVRGLERVEDAWIYVSCGTGYWGPPFRLGAPAEITRLVLKRA